MTDLVEAMHHQIAGGPRVLGRPLEAPARLEQGLAVLRDHEMEEDRAVAAVPLEKPRGLLQGAALEAEARAGGGTVFRVSLPRPAA